jgi:hypothetical protein
MRSWGWSRGKTVSSRTSAGVRLQTGLTMGRALAEIWSRRDRMRIAGCKSGYSVRWGGTGAAAPPSPCGTRAAGPPAVDGTRPLSCASRPLRCSSARLAVVAAPPAVGYPSGSPWHTGLLHRQLRRVSIDIPELCVRSNSGGVQTYTAAHSDHSRSAHPA